MERDFSPWRKWDHRITFEGKEIPGIKSPGIYVVAISSVPILAGTSFSISGNVVYVGMTTASLKGRLKAFDRTITKTRLEHGGADRFLGTHRNFEAIKDHVYVSTKHWRLDDMEVPERLRTKGVVAAAEYEMFALCVEKLGDLPVFNRATSMKFDGWPKKSSKPRTLSTSGRSPKSRSAQKRKGV